ncbi:retrovirus-related pol polyprotein from transposon TNT 1-94 [Tanacetum coccineum]
MHNQWRQPTIQDMTVLLKNLLIPLAIKSKDDGFKFVHELKKEMFADLEYVQSLEKEVDELESEKANFSKEYDLLFQIQVRQPLFQVIERYKWTLKTKKKWVPKIRKDIVSKSISSTIDIASRTPNDSTPNTDLGSNLSNVPSSSNSLADCSTHPIHCTVHCGNDQFSPILGNDLLTGNRGSDLYAITLQETMSATPICFMAKTSPTQAWLWHPQVITVRTDRGIEFLNKTLHAYFKEEGIELQTSTPGTPEQNGAIERRNRTLVEDARMMLSAFNLPLFFWAEAIATTFKHLYIFGCTCYITQDGGNLDKMKEKGDPCIFVRYSIQSKGYRVYNKRTRLIVKSIHINFVEIKELSKASDYDNSGPAPQLQMTSDHNRLELVTNDYNNEPSSSKLVLNVSPQVDTNAPSLQELDFLFSPLFKEYFTAGNHSASKSSAVFDNFQQQDSQPTKNIQPTIEPITLTTNVNAKENNSNQAADAYFVPYEFFNPFCTPIQEFAESSSCNIDNSNMHTFYQCLQSDYRWTKNDPLKQVRGNPSKPV